MLLFNLTCLAVYATLGVTPSTAISANSVVAADSTPLLTVDVLTRMTAFWVAFRHEPQSVRDTADATTEKAAVTLDLGGDGKQDVFIVDKDFVAIAKKCPSVAADFKKAGLTPEQWGIFKKEIIAATMSEDVGGYNGVGALPTPSSVVGRNVDFLAAHEKEYHKLLAAGVWIPKAQY